MMRIKDRPSSNHACFVTHSGLIAIDDIDAPYISLLTYMILSSNLSHTELASILNLKAPEGMFVSDDASPVQ